MSKRNGQKKSFASAISSSFQSGTDDETRESYPTSNEISDFPVYSSSSSSSSASFSPSKSTSRIQMAQEEESISCGISLFEDVKCKDNSGDIKMEPVEEFFVFKRVLELCRGVVLKGKFAKNGEELLLWLFGPIDMDSFLLHVLYPFNHTNGSSSLENSQSRVYLFQETFLAILEWISTLYSLIHRLADSMTRNHMSGSSTNWASHLIEDLFKQNKKLECWDKDTSGDTYKRLSIFKYCMSFLFLPESCMLVDQISANASENEFGFWSVIETVFTWKAFLDIMSTEKTEGVSMSYLKESVSERHLRSCPQHEIFLINEFIQFTVKPLILLNSYFSNMTHKLTTTSLTIIRNSNIKKPRQDFSSSSMGSTNQEVSRGNSHNRQQSGSIDILKRHWARLYIERWSDNWELKSDIVYKWPNTLSNLKDFDTCKMEFRKLFALVWYNIPPCIRRGIMYHYDHESRFGYNDQLKFVWFMYSAFFRPLSSKQHRHVFNETFMEHLTIDILKHLQNPASKKRGSDHRYTDEHHTRFESIFKKKIEAHAHEDENNIHISEKDNTDKNKIPMLSCSTLAGFESQKPKISYTSTSSSNLEDIPIKKSKKGSKTSDKRDWVDNTCVIICPFSSKTLLRKCEDEWRYLSEMPPPLIKDIEDLGYNVIKPPDMDNKLGPRVISHLYKTDISLGLSEVCKSCTPGICISKKESNIETLEKDTNFMPVSKKKFNFRNPTERFLKDVNLGQLFH